MEHSEQNKDQSNFWQGNPKTMFAMGLISGVAVMATLALILVLNFLFSGKSVGALGLGNQVAQQPTAQPSQPAVEDPTALPSQPPREVDETRDHIYGNKNAKVTLIEYSDFECPFCSRHFDTMQQIKKDFPNDVRVVFRHFPLSFHPEAQKAGEASECAAAQGKFWEMYEKIFAANKAGSMNVAAWKQAAKDLGLDTAKFDKCLDSGEMASRVTEDLNEGSQAGVGGTPATFVNGELLEGALPYETFKQAIQAAGAQG